MPSILQESSLRKNFLTTQFPCSTMASGHKAGHQFLASPPPARRISVRRLEPLAIPGGHNARHEWRHEWRSAKLPFREDAPSRQPQDCRADVFGGNRCRSPPGHPSPNYPADGVSIARRTPALPNQPDSLAMATWELKGVGFSPNTSALRSCSHALRETGLTECHSC